MSSLFVGEDDELGQTLLQANEVQEESTSEGLNHNLPQSSVSDDVDEEVTEVCCTLPLKFQQEIVEDMLLRDGLLILGRGLGWKTIAANLLHALCSPILLQKGPGVAPKRSLIMVLNAREGEILLLEEELTELQWIDNATKLELSDDEALTVIRGEATTADKRRRLYDKGGVVSVTSRVLAVDMLSGVIKCNEITGLLIVHAETMKEASNESFIVNLYRDENDWGFVKAISDEPESFTGFTPLATSLKVLRLTNVFLWPRFHVEVSSSLQARKKGSKDDRRSVIEINTKMSYKMKKIQAAILACIEACLNELKRHNGLLATEYWDMENVHDRDFVPRIRMALDSQWHRITYTSKQLIYDLGTLKDFLKHLLSSDSLKFYQTVQNIIDLNVKSKTGTGALSTTTISPWLNLEEATTIISFAKERALGKLRIERSKTTLEEQDESLEELTPGHISTHEEYNLELQPKWGQLGLLLDDIMHEKAILGNVQQPILIMCSDLSTTRQLAQLLPILELKDNGGRKIFSARKYMIRRLNDYLAWKELSRLTKQINTELEVKEEDTDSKEDDDIYTSKTFSRGRGEPISKRRRTRGASTVALVTRLHSSAGLNQISEAPDLDPVIVDNLKREVSDEDVLESGGFEVNDEIYVDENSTQRQEIEHISQMDQIVIENYHGNNNDFIQELSPSHIIMYEPNLPFIRAVEIYQAINKDTPAKTYFMYYGTSVEEQKHLMQIKKEKDAFTRLIREKANLGRHYETAEDNNKFRLQRSDVVNTRIAGGANFRTESDEFRVIVDIREFTSSLPGILYRAGIKVVPCMLTIGDYIVTPKVCVERKAIPDLISSFKSGRLYTQCEHMFRHYELPTLLIEFDGSKSFSFEPFADIRPQKGNAPNAIATKLLKQDIQSKLMMLLLAFPKLKIIWSFSPYETAQIFLEIKSKQEEPDIDSAISKGVNQSLTTEKGEPPVFNEDAIDLIQNIPGINNANYYSVINRFKSIETLVSLTEDELVETLGQENGIKAYRFIHRSLR